MGYLYLFIVGIPMLVHGRYIQRYSQGAARGDAAARLR